MKRPNNDVVAAMGACSKHYPKIWQWLDEWHKAELTQLPHVAQNTAIAQGRCQVLGELCKFVNQSPDIVRQNPQG